MKQKVSFQRKMLVGFFVLFSLLALFGWKMVQTFREAEENSRRLVHTLEEVESLDELLLTMVDAETGSRGYVITGNPEFLEPFELSA